MRGRRMFQFAQGDVLELMQILFSQTLADLIGKFDADLDAELRLRLVSTFEKGRGYLVFTFTLKLTPIMSPPYCAFACGHPDDAESRAAFARLIGCDDQHPKVRQLQEGDLNVEVLMYIDGCDSSDLPLCEEYRCTMCFAFSCERSVEGEHALLHQYGLHSPQHTAAYDSFYRRMKIVSDRLEKDSGFFVQLSAALDQARNPKRAAEALGFSSHPGFHWGKSTWDPIYAKIVYRADSLSAQSVPPAVDYSETPPPPPPIADADMMPPPPVPAPMFPSPSDAHEDVPSSSSGHGAGAISPYVVDVLALPKIQKHASEFCSYCPDDPIFRDLALEHVRNYLRSSIGRPHLFSMHTNSLAVRLLSNMLAPTRSNSSDPANTLELVRDNRDRSNLGSWKNLLFFTVVTDHPGRAKLLKTGSLTREHIGIQVHRLVSVSREGIVTSASAVGAGEDGDAGSIVNKALVLAPEVFSLQ